VQNPWGPYRSMIEESVDACSDYTRRLRRSVEGEIPSDRRYVQDKAYALREAAELLIARCCTVERWLHEDASQ
jgi:hypothetical protein